MPHLADVTVDRIHETDGQIVVEARSGRDQAACPGCGTGSARVHGRYHRRLADTALAGRPVVIRLLVRRLICRRAGCARVTFVEQIPGLTTPHSRYSPPLRVALTAIAVALAGPALGWPGGRGRDHRIGRLPHGLVLQVARPAAPGEIHQPRVRPFPGDASLAWAARFTPPEFLRLGVQFADGSMISNMDSLPFDEPDEPAGPQLVENGGAGDLRGYEFPYWVWRLPPPGAVTFTCQWPAYEIQEARAQIDAQRIRDAAARSIDPWPGDS